MELPYLHDSVDQLSLAKFHEMGNIRFFNSLRIQTVIQHLVMKK